MVLPHSYSQHRPWTDQHGKNHQEFLKFFNSSNSENPKVWWKYKSFKQDFPRNSKDAKLGKIWHSLYCTVLHRRVNLKTQYTCLQYFAQREVLSYVFLLSLKKMPNCYIEDRLMKHIIHWLGLYQPIVPFKSQLTWNEN